MGKYHRDSLTSLKKKLPKSQFWEDLMRFRIFMTQEFKKYSNLYLKTTVS